MFCSIFSRKGAKVAKNFYVYFVLTPNTFACFAPWRELIAFVSRRGAEAAENFDVYFVLTPNTFAYFAPWRELIVFSLAEAQRPQGISMYILFSPQTPLRTLRLGESSFGFFSRKGAKVARNFDVGFVVTPNTSACSAPLRDYIFCLSQRRRGRRELRCLFCSYPNTFAYFAPWRELIVFLSRRGAEAARNFNVGFVVTPNTSAPLREFVLQPFRSGQTRLY